MNAIRLVALGLSLSAGLSGAEAGGGRGGSTAGNALLRGAPGAQSAAMGGAFTAVAGGPVALYYNAAALDALDRNRLLLQYDRSFLDIARSDAAFGMPFAGGGLGFGISVIDYGSIIQTTTVNKTNAGTFSANDMLVRTGYGRAVGDRLALGATIGYYRLEIAEVTASGVTADVGALYRSPWPGLDIGAAVRNIGSRARFTRDDEELPLAIALGAAYRPTARLLVALDYESTRNQDGVVRAGLEYRVIPALAIRAGYNGSNETDNGLTFGAGFAFNDIQLDYAYVPFGDLGKSHRVSAEVAFGAPMALPQERVAVFEPARAAEPATVTVAPPVSARSPAREERGLVPTALELKHRASAAVDAGRPADAIRDYRAAIALDPADATTRYNLATALYLTGRFSDAAWVFRDLAESNPEDEEAWMYLGLSELRAGRRDEGVRALRYVLELNPRNEHARRALAGSDRVR